MAKFSVGDTVKVADPAYVTTVDDAHGWVSKDMFGVTGEIIDVYEDDSGDRVGTAYEVQHPDRGLTQMISQRYLSLAPKVTFVELPDGVYRDPENYDVVLVGDGKVTQVLATGDGCPTDGIHLGFYKEATDASKSLVRLVAPGRDASLPTDGFYADRDGDLVQVKGDKVRFLSDVSDLSDWMPLDEQYPTYAPYTPLVEAASK